MATIRGGDVRGFSLGGRSFQVITEAAFELTPSGKQNEFKATGAGQMVGTQKRVLGAIDGIEVSIDNESGDLEYLSGVRDDGEPVAANLDLADGSAWAGSLGIEGDLKYKTDTGTATLSLRGPKLEQI